MNRRSFLAALAALPFIGREVMACDFGSEPSSSMAALREGDELLDCGTLDEVMRRVYADPIIESITESDHLWDSLSYAGKGRYVALVDAAPGAGEGTASAAARYWTVNLARP